MIFCVIGLSGKGRFCLAKPFSSPRFLKRSGNKINLQQIRKWANLPDVVESFNATHKLKFMIMEFQENPNFLTELLRMNQA